jgi:Holliday junction resolvase RusA-like endonuclease
MTVPADLHMPDQHGYLQAAPGGSKNGMASPAGKTIPAGTPVAALRPGPYVKTRPGKGASRFHPAMVKVQDANKKLKPWQDNVKAVAEPTAPRELLKGSLAIIVTFTIVRRPSHYRQGATTAHLLARNAPARPSMAPDTTKLLRGFEDALTGIVWVDDAQIVWQAAAKRYGAKVETSIEVWEVGPA